MERGYYVLIPELGPSHWMNEKARCVLDTIVDRVLMEYPIDRNRVHVMGTSMGGGSALAYAIHRPEIIGPASEQFEGEQSEVTVLPRAITADEIRRMQDSSP